MTIPVLIPPATPELYQPYLTPLAFQAYPTWLDLDNLIPGGVAALQVDELADVLLTASRWAVTSCDEMPLHAHYVQNETKRTRADSSGRVFIRPNDIPVRAIVSMSLGYSPETMAAVTLPDPTMWIEDGREVSLRPGGISTVFTGMVLEFGPRFRPFGQSWVQWSYVPGYPSTVLQASCAQNAAVLSVTDPTGILPGDVLRIYDVGDTSSTTGANEAVTVASTYAPATPTVPPTVTSVPLAAGTAFAHQAGILVTGMPRSILQAVICYAVALLMREDVTSDEPASGIGANARTSTSRGGEAGGLINDALGFLAPFRPVLRS